MDGHRIIDVNGVDLCVDTAGDAADPAILLIGGMGASMDWWEEEFCQRLAAGGRFAGDAVVAFLPMTAPGAAAEYAAVPADVLAAAPRRVELADAAALPSSGLTAWQSLFEHAGLKAGQSIDAGDLKIDVAQRRPLTDLPTVHDQAAAGQLPGKTILIP